MPRLFRNHLKEWENFYEKHQARIIIRILIFAGVAYGTLNCSGMCVSQFRYLSDEEKIRITATRASTTGVYSSLNRRKHIKMDGSHYFEQALPYESLEAFYKENPNCCYVVNVIDEPYGDEDPPPTFWNMAMGQYNYRVRATFIQRTIITPVNPDKGEGEEYIKESLVKGKTALYGNCGLPAYKYIADFN